MENINGDHMAYSVVSHDGNLASGLSKQELFAAMAMQGLAANSEISAHGQNSEEQLADMAVEKADCLINALNKQKP